LLAPRSTEVTTSYERDLETGGRSEFSGRSLVMIRHCSSSYDPLPDGSLMDRHRSQSMTSTVEKTTAKDKEYFFFNTRRNFYDSVTALRQGRRE
jgi:hypothetical protein